MGIIGKKPLTDLKKYLAMQCECPSVRTISFIVGVLNVLFSALFTIRVVVHLAIFNHLEKEIPKNDTAKEDDVKLGMSTLLFMLVIGIIWFASSLLLVKGIAQERFKLMSWWIYFNYIVMSVIFGTAVIAFITDCIYWTTFGNVFMKLVLYIVGSGTSFLIFYPVFLLYKRLQVNAEQQALKDSEAYDASCPDPRPSEFYAN